jgi:hypothetical protein
MTTRMRPEADRSAKRNERLVLGKKTLKDLNTQGKGPGGGWLRPPITVSCPQPQVTRP